MLHSVGLKPCPSNGRRSFTALLTVNEPEKLNTKMDNNIFSELPPARASLVEAYPMAKVDFWRGIDTPICIYKSGPEWPPLLDKLGWKMRRETRPIGPHPIVQTWASILDSLEPVLDSLDVKFTSISAFAFANEGESKPFCEVLVYVSVVPLSLNFNEAVFASYSVKDILAKAGFPELEVAFVESLVSLHSRRKLLSGNLDNTQAASDILRVAKPFNTVLGAPIAPLARPHIKGSAGLVVRIGDQPALTTCAHFTRQAPPRPPPPVQDGLEVPETQKIILMDTASFSAAVDDIAASIDTRTELIEEWQLEQASASDTLNTAAIQRNIDATMDSISLVKALQDEVAQPFSATEDRVIGSILFQEPVGDFENDWALISLDCNQLDVGSANRIFLGSKFDSKMLDALLSPPTANVGASAWQYPNDGYLRASSIVGQNDFKDPPHLDSNDNKCLLVAKNGAGSGLTFGYANLVESLVRIYPTLDQPKGHTMREIAILPCRGPQEFATSGDSGAIVLDIHGRIVSHITSGINSGITFTTPYWRIEQQIRARFPTYSRYDAGQ